MASYTLNEVNGKLQGNVILVQAENAIEAMKKCGMTSWVRSYEMFKKTYFGKVYEVYKTGEPHNVQYVCHK